MKGVIRFLLRHVILDILVALVLITIGAIGFFIWRISQGPIELSFLEDDFEAALQRSLNVASVDVESVSLVWLGQERAFRLRALNVQAFDGDGRTVFQAPDAEAVLRASPLFIGRVELKRFETQGLDVFVVRDREGRIGWSVASREEAFERALSQTVTPGTAKPLETLTTALSSEQGALADLQDVSLTDATIDVLDDVNGLVVRLTRVTGSVRREDNSVSVDLSGTVLQGEGVVPGAIRLEARTRNDLSFHSVTLQATGFNPAALWETGAQTGYTPPVWSNLDAPVSVRAGLFVTGGTLFEVLDADVEIGQGLWGRRDLAQPDDTGTSDPRPAIAAGKLTATYDNDLAALVISELELETDALSIKGNGRFDQPQRLFSPSDMSTLPVEMQLSTLRLASGDAFPEPLVLTDVNAKGAVFPRQSRITFDTLTTLWRNLRVSAQADIAAATDETGPRLRLSGRADGSASASDVLALWPEAFASGGREWLEEAAKAGTVSDIAFSVRIDDETREEGGLRDDALTLSFAMQDARVEYLPGFPVMENARGRAQIRGNSLRAELDYATSAGMTLTNGLVDIPRMRPIGAPVTYAADVSGPIENLLSWLDTPMLGYTKAMGIDPRDIGGTTRFRFEVIRPLRTVPVPFTFGVQGQAQALTMPLPGLLDEDLVLSTAEYEASFDGVTISGDGTLFGVPVSVSLSHALNGQPDPTQMRISGQVPVRVLDRFALPVRSWLSGEMGATVSVQGDGLAFTTLSGDLDLTDTLIAPPDVNWRKDVGLPARLSVSGLRTAAETFSFSDIRFESDRDRIIAQADIARDGRLVLLNAPEVQVSGMVDASVSVRRPTGPEGPIDAVLQGRFLDVRGLIGGVMRTAGGGTAGSAESSFFPPGLTVNLDTQLEQVRVSDSVDLTDARLVLRHVDQRVESLSFTANSPGGGISASLDPIDGAERAFTLQAADAGAAFAVLFGFDSISGGDFTLTGVNRPGEVSEAQLLMEGFTVVDAPALAQLLSLISLQGFADTLGGAGIAFDRFDAEVTLADGIVEIAEARASGPSIGVSLDGIVDLEERSLDLAGTIVPSYALNSLLGNAPVIGELFSGRQSKGLFAFTFTMDGPFGATQVVVNPASALAPGFLRRMFEGSRPLRDPATATVPEVLPDEDNLPADGGVETDPADPRD